MSVAQAADILALTPAAIYARINNSKNNFSAPELLMLLEWARSKDDPKIKLIRSYIERNYLTSSQESARRMVICSRRRGVSRVIKACLKADNIVFFLSDNEQYLAKDTPLGMTLEELQARRLENVFVAAPSWIAMKLQQKGQSSHIRAVDYYNRPALPLVILQSLLQVRGFLFGVDLTDEMFASDANHWWREAKYTFSIS